MSNQEILDNAPVGEGIDLVDITGEYFDEHCNHLDSRGLWSPHNIGPVSPRSLADIKRIVELESIMFDLLSLSSFAMSFPFEYDKLEALKDKP
jgi:hypothetical protein